MIFAIVFPASLHSMSRVAPSSSQCVVPTYGTNTPTFVLSLQQSPLPEFLFRFSGRYEPNVLGIVQNCDSSREAEAWRDFRFCVANSGVYKSKTYTSVEQNRAVIGCFILKCELRGFGLFTAKGST
jgi:hypothetical protein